MKKENFKKWKIAMAIAAVMAICGFLTCIFFQKYEPIGLAVFFPALLIAVFCSAQINFDNKQLWAFLTFLMPYIFVPITLLRKYENINKRLELNKNRAHVVAQSNMASSVNSVQQKIEKYIILMNKSTISSMLSAGNIWRELIDVPKYRQALCLLVLDTKVAIDVRMKGIEMLFEVVDNEYVSNVFEALSNDSDQQIRDFVQQVKQVSYE